MCSPQSSNMDDVNRLLHLMHQACAVVLQDTQNFKFLRWEDQTVPDGSRWQKSELVSRENLAVSANNR